MVHDPNLVEHGSQPSVETMSILLNGRKLGMFHCYNLILVDAFIHAE